MAQPSPQLPKFSAALTRDFRGLVKLAESVAEFRECLYVRGVNLAKSESFMQQVADELALGLYDAGARFLLRGKRDV